MNKESDYKVTFSGHLVPEMNGDEVRRNLARLFKCSEQTIEKLFTGKTVTIKGGLTEQRALAYQQAMQKAGAIAHIKTPMVADDIDDLPPPPSAYYEDDEDDLPPPPPAAVTNAAGRLGIAPSDQWKMEATGTRLSKPKRPSTKPKPETEHLQLSPPKTEVGQAKRKVEALNPDTSHLDVAEVGADMGQAKHKKDPVNPDISSITLDESTGNINQLKHEKELLNPDTSYLKLEID